jgi:hypothetical protein
MNDPLMIGTRGWEHAAWTGGFYPAELPDDWRFCFYSNNLRSVLVPVETWRTDAPPDVKQWLEDSDPAFRFVLELPEALGRPLTHGRRDQALDAFLDGIKPIAPRVAGLLLRIASDTPVWPDGFEHLLGQLADVAPVCTDLPEGGWRDANMLAALDRQGAGLAWHCGSEPAPRAGGGLMVALAPPADARSVRHWIEQLAGWQGHGPEARAGLFFETSERSARSAQEARLIAELMGV